MSNKKQNFSVLIMNNLYLNQVVKPVPSVYQKSSSQV